MAREDLDFIGRLNKRGQLTAVAREAVLQRARELIEASGTAGSKGDRDDYRALVPSGAVYRLRVALAELDRLRAQVETARETPASRLVPDHECTPVADFSRHMEGDVRQWWLGEITRPPDGYPHEKWCLHIRTPLKPEIAFCFNEADFTYLAATSYAAIGYHTAPEWIASIVEVARKAVRPECLADAPAPDPLDAEIEAVTAYTAAEERIAALEKMLAQALTWVSPASGTYALGHALLAASES